MLSERLKFYSDPFPHAIITNYYDENSLKHVWQELEAITLNDMLQPAELTYSAKDENDGSLLKRNWALVLDSLYPPENSCITMYMFNNLITAPDMIEAFKKSSDLILRYFFDIGLTGTLVSYYENGDYYNKHTDKSVLTTLIHLYKEPKQFTGGELVFPEHNYTLPIENNRCIVFPSIVPHAVNEIRMEKENKTYGRYCITHLHAVMPGRN